jgi:hypothetical protein
MFTVSIITGQKYKTFSFLTKFIFENRHFLSTSRSKLVVNHKKTAPYPVELRKDISEKTRVMKGLLRKSKICH